MSLELKVARYYDLLYLFEKVRNREYNREMHENTKQVLNDLKKLDINKEKIKELREKLELLISNDETYYKNERELILDIIFLISEIALELAKKMRYN